MCPESFAGFRFDLGPLLQGQMWFFIPIMTYQCQGFRISSLLWNLITLLLVVEGFSHVKTTYRKSCAPNLLAGSDLTLDPSFKVECGSWYLWWTTSPLLLVIEVLDVKTTYRKSFALNLLVGSVWHNTVYVTLQPCPIRGYTASRCNI